MAPLQPQIAAHGRVHASVLNSWGGGGGGVCHHIRNLVVYINTTINKTNQSNGRTSFKKENAAHTVSL